jgi:hypothetical protein
MPRFDIFASTLELWALERLTSDSRVHAAANCANHLASRPNQFANSCDLLADELGHCPFLLSATNADSEVLKKLATLGGVGNLGVELNAVHGLRLVGNCGEFRVLGLANCVEALGQVAELIAVTHPNGHSILKALEKLIDVASEPGGLQISVTVFTSSTGDNVVGV